VRFVALLAIAMAACGRSAARAPVVPPLDGPVAARTTPDAEFRATPPIAGGLKAFTPPKVEERKLKNGVRVLFVERHDVPIVALRVVSDRGADQADPGIAEFWERAALRSSSEHSMHEVLEAWNDLGAYFRPHVTRDSSQFEVRVMSRLLGATVKLLGELTTRPAFGPKQVNLIRERMRVAVADKWDDAEGQLALAIHEHLFPETHLYRSPFAPPDSIEKVQPEILEAYQKFAFTSEHVTITAAGDTKIDELLAALEPAFGSLAGPKIGPQAPPAAPPDAPLDPRVIAIHREGTQATIGAVWLGPTRAIPDLAALSTAAQELHAVLSTRLRVQLGITYDVDFTSQVGRARLPMYVSSAVDIEHTGEAASEIMKALERLNKELVEEKFLAEDRAAVADFAELFDSVHGTAATLAHLAVYALPLDYYTRRADAIAKVTGEDLRKAFATYFPVDRVKLFVVGDLGKVVPQLEKVGLGKVAHRKMFTLTKK